ncbi:hypothetical protein BC628DRAFT_964066 [Trametes gibbosa]|nr:hypothetical protein BC628DRAFT_964066 [Trametes gibbosa]
MDSLGRILAAFLFLLHLFLLPAQAQSVHGFNWGFSTQSTSSNIVECQTSPVRLIPLDGTSSLGVPPYYMLAIEVQGTTTLTSIGNDPTQLLWQNTHRTNAQLLLTVMDSNGSTAGFPPSFFNVIAASDGKDTSCLIPDPTPSTPRITPNVSTELQTCQPWGLTITGGTKPYSVTLGQLNSGVITNVTMGPLDDVLTYINRAAPNEPLIAAVVDATGQWGVSTIAVNTAGSTDADCPGLNTSSKTKAQIQAEQVAAAAAQASAAKSHSTTIALAILFGVVVPVLIVAGVGFWWWRRRRRLFRESRLVTPVTKPTPYDPEQQGGAGRPSLNLDMSQVSNMLRVNSQNRRSATWAVDTEEPIRQTDSPTSMDMSTQDVRHTMPTPYLISATLPRPTPTIKSPRSPADGLALMTPNSTSPAATLTAEARYRKALEAHAGAQAVRARLQAQMSVVSSPGQSPVAGPSSRPLSGRPLVQRSHSAAVMRTFPAQTLPRRAGASLRLPPVAAIAEDGGEGPDIIIQHRDGGIVEELPPPYLDSYAPRASGLSGRGRAAGPGLGLGSPRS